VNHFTLADWYVMRLLRTTSVSPSSSASWCIGHVSFGLTTGLLSTVKWPGLTSM
jgi:hypothetical protein